MITDKIFLYAYKKVKKIVGGKGLTKYPFVKSMKIFAYSHLHSNFANIQEHKMFLDPHDSMRLAINEIYEPTETELLKKLIKKGDIVLDIGAHIGYYTLIMAKLVGKEGKVFAFEPEPSNYKILQKNVEINSYHNVVLEKKAAADRNGIIDLYLSLDSSGMHRIYPSKHCKDKIQINSLKLDNYFQNSKFLNKIGLIKIDVEGAEFNVLKGTIEILKNNKKIKLLLEFIPDSIKECGNQPIELVEFLISHGFQISYINEKEKKIETKTSVKKILDSQSLGTNLFCEKT